MNRALNQTRKGNRGLTVMEMLVVVAVIAILAALFLSGLSAAKERARRVQCRSNIRQIYQTLQDYSNDNNDLLPNCTKSNPDFFGSWWPWDLHTNLVHELEHRGAIRRILYCPSYVEMDDDRHWNFWKYNKGIGSPIRVLGYAFLMNGCRQVPTNLWRTSILDADAGTSDSELVVDVTISQKGNYSVVKGRYVDRTSHLAGTKPAGGNIAFLDGHAEWRDHRLMKHRIYGSAVWDY